MKKRHITLLFLLGAAFFLLCACGADEKPQDEAVSAPPTVTPEVKPSPSATSTPTPTPSPSPSQPEEEDEGPVNPLTGLPMDEEKTNDRPVAIMLNNLREAIPQQGNGQADMIYEVVTEGGITRMLGVYQSLDDVPTIGSVRSSRTCYLEIALGHDALYVHAGGSEEAYEKMDEWDVDHMDGVRGKFSYSGLFWRKRDRIEGKWFNTEHSLVTSGEAILKNLSESGFRLEHEEDYEYEISFTEDGTPANGSDAQIITIPFSQYKTGVFSFDAERAVYLAEEYNQPYIDGNTGEQIAVTNVLILLTEITNTGDRYGHTDVELKEGDGWYACGGKIIPITWEKGGRDQQFRYYTEDGEPLVLGRGKSYVNVVSQTSEISYE